MGIRELSIMAWVIILIAYLAASDEAEKVYFYGGLKWYFKPGVFINKLIVCSVAIAAILAFAGGFLYLLTYPIWHFLK